MVDAFFKAHAIIQKQVAWQEEIQNQIGMQKEQVKEHFSWETWQKKVNDFLTFDRVKTTFMPDKLKRAAAIDTLTQEFINGTSAGNRRVCFFRQDAWIYF